MEFFLSIAFWNQRWEPCMYPHDLFSFLTILKQSTVAIEWVGCSLPQRPLHFLRLRGFGEQLVQHVQFVRHFCSDFFSISASFRYSTIVFYFLSFPMYQLSLEEGASFNILFKGGGNSFCWNPHVLVRPELVADIRMCEYV